MGKKKSRGKQRNFKQPHEEVQLASLSESHIEAPVVTNVPANFNSNESIGVKMLFPPQGDLKVSNLVTTQSEQEKTVRDSFSVIENGSFIPSNETNCSNKPFKEDVIPNPIKFSEPSFTESAATNDPGNNNNDELVIDKLNVLPQTLKMNPKPNTGESEKESVARDTVLEAENECLITENVTFYRKNSVEESVLPEPEKFLESCIKTSTAANVSEGSDSNAFNRNGMADYHQTATRDSNSTTVESDQKMNTRDSSSEAENECLISKDEIISSEKSSKETIISETISLSEAEASFGDLVVKNKPVSSIKNELHRKRGTTIYETSTSDSNLTTAESEKERIIRCSTLVTEKGCSIPLNEKSTINNQIQEPEMLSDSSNEPNEVDLQIIVQTSQTQSAIGQEPFPHRNTNMQTVSKAKSAEDKIFRKDDNKKYKRKNKRTVSTKINITLDNSQTDKHNLTLPSNCCKNFNPKENESDTSHHNSSQCIFENSPACEDLSDKSKSDMVDDDIQSLVQNTSNDDGSIVTAEVSNTKDTHVPCQVIPSIDESNEGKGMKQSNEKREYTFCKENKQNENTSAVSLSLDVVSSNLMKVDKCSPTATLGEEKYTKNDTNFNYLTTEADCLKGMKRKCENFSVIEPGSAKISDENELFICAGELTSGNQQGNNSKLLKNNVLPETVNIIEVNQCQEEIRASEDTIKPNPEKTTTLRSNVDLKKLKFNEEYTVLPSLSKKEENLGPKDSIKEERSSTEKYAHLAKGFSYSEKMDLPGKKDVFNSFADDNLDMILLKHERHKLKCQRKEKENVQDNISCVTGAASKKKILVLDEQKQGYETKQAKLKSKTSNDQNTKNIKENVPTVGSSKVDEIKASNRENIHLVETVNKVLAAEDSIKGSGLLDADEKFPARPIFMANTCHVCKSTHEGTTRLKSCSACRLIAYCCKEHQRLHWKEHKSICQQVQKMIKQSGLTDLFANAYKVTEPEDWRKYRCYHLVETERYLGRPLLPYEREMFLYPRVCSTCHKSDPEKLKVCKVCHFINYCCSEHIPNTHNIWCKELKLLLEINQYQSRNGLMKPHIPYFSLDSSKPFPKNMRDFIFASLETKHNVTNFTLYEATLSDVASYPLTVLYVLHCLYQEGFKKSSCNKLTIHLVGAENQFEVDTISKWDTFLLNLLPQLSELHLVFIGPELMPSDFSEMNHKNYNKRLCKTINTSKKLLTEFHYAKLYHEYAKEKNFSKPDLICAFNCGIYRFTGFNNRDTWGPTMSIMVKDKHIPIVLTAYTAVEAPKDVERFKKDFRIKVLMSPTKNPFASMKPNQNFVSDDEAPVIYKNQYLSVIKGDNELKK